MPHTGWLLSQCGVSGATPVLSGCDRDPCQSQSQEPCPSRETLRGSFLSPLLQRPLWAIKSLLSCDAESQCGDIHPSPRLGMSTSLVFGHPTSRATPIPPLPLSTLWANRWPHSLLSPSPHSLHNPEASLPSRASAFPSVCWVCGVSPLRSGFEWPLLGHDQLTWDSL